MIRHSSKINGYSESNRKDNKALHLEKRKCARVSIGVPISCVSVDSESKPLDQNKGIIMNVSQTGVRIDANYDVSSDRLKLAFVDFNKSI